MARLVAKRVQVFDKQGVGKYHLQMGNAIIEWQYV
jgi:hypothetical protein